jgi:hypothetical protein
MTSRWPISVVVAIATAGALLPAGAGCSCKESEKPKEEIVRVQRNAPAAPPGQEAAQEGQPAPQAPGARPARQAARTERVPGESVIHGPVDYLRTVTITAPRQARKTIDMAYIQNEVKQFYAMKERFPNSLDELVQWRGEPLPETPSGYVYKYDAATGKVEVVPGQ